MRRQRECESQRENENTREVGDPAWMKERAKEKEGRNENENVRGLLSRVVSWAGRCTRKRSSWYEWGEVRWAAACCTGVNTTEDVDIGVDIGVAAAALIQGEATDPCSQSNEVVEVVFENDRT